MPWEEGRGSAEFLLSSGDRIHFVPGVRGEREAPVIFIVIVGVIIITIVTTITITIIIIITITMKTTWLYKEDQQLRLL